MGRISARVITEWPEMQDEVRRMVPVQEGQEA